MGRKISNDWAEEHVAALKRWETVQFRPVGGSMRGIIESGDLVEVEPFAGFEPKLGDVVLVRVRDFTYLHLIKKVEDDENGYRHFQIGNNRGGTNGWVDRNAIYGRLKSVNGKEVDHAGAARVRAPACDRPGAA